MPKTASFIRSGLAALALSAAILAPQVAAAQEQNPDFTLVNNTTRTIIVMQASPVTTDQWGPDRLGRETVRPGGRFEVQLNAPGVCQWDVRVIYDNRQAEERRNINLCAVTELPFDGSRAAAAAR